MEVFSRSFTYSMERSSRWTGMMLVYAIRYYHSSLTIFQTSLEIRSISCTLAVSARPVAFATWASWLALLHNPATFRSKSAWCSQGFARISAPTIKERRNSSLGSPLFPPVLPACAAPWHLSGQVLHGSASSYIHLLSFVEVFSSCCGNIGCSIQYSTGRSADKSGCSILGIFSRSMCVNSGTYAAYRA